MYAQMQREFNMPCFSDLVFKSAEMSNTPLGVAVWPFKTDFLLSYSSYSHLVEEATRIHTYTQDNYLSLSREARVDWSGNGARQKRKERILVALGRSW